MARAPKVVHTKLKGLKELEINISRLIKQVGGEAVERALLKDAAILRKDIVRRLYARWGYRSGGAGKSFVVKKRTKRKAKPGVLTIAVASDKKLLPKRGKYDKSPAPYPRYLEYGTSKLAAKPFFRPAIRAYRKLARTEGALKRLMARAGNK